MTPRARLDTEAVVAAAAELADAGGLEAVTLASLARRLGVRSPSLYAHIGGLEDLRRRIGMRAARDLGALLSAAAAGRARGDALGAIAHAYRDYARSHPGSYAALQRLSDQRDETVVAASAPVEVVVAVLRGYGLEGDDAIHATRVVRAALHGFVSLEAESSFGIPIPVQESFERLIAVLDGGLAGAAR